MIRKHLLFFFILTGFGAFAQQNPVAVKYAETITAEDLKGNLSIIASDAMEGRETGKRGQKMAAAFIASHFEDLNLTAPVNGSYYQPVPLYELGVPTVTFRAGPVEFTQEEYLFIGSADTGGMIDMPVVFIGKGTEAEMSGIDLKGKAVMFLADPEMSSMNNPVIRALRDKEAKMIFTVIEKNEDFKQISGMVRSFGSGRLTLSKQSAQGSTGLFYVSALTAEKMFNTKLDKLKKATADKKTGKVKPATVSYSIAQSYKDVKSENVLGLLEGTDKKDEVIVITSHYDHTGISTRATGDKINNGADDDGSGTVAVLALAKSFVQAKNDGKGARRSILFMTVTGEEKGLLGSEYYAENPVYPLSNTVVNLNIDMIGRSDPQHKDSAPYVYVIGADKLSSELHTLSETTNKTYTNLIFDYTYNDQNHPDRLYYRSDHWNFARKDIPIIFYFDGIHEDYHKPSDEVDKIEFDLLTLRAKIVFHTAWELANRENRLAVDKK